MQKILSAELELCSTLHLFDLQIIFITMPQEARKGKSQGGTSMRASKRTLWVFTARKQMKNRGTKSAFILVVVRPTVIPQFHQIFASSAPKTKTDKKLSCVFVLTWRRAKAKLVNNKSLLAIKTTDQEQFGSVTCTSFSFNWNHTAIQITRDTDAIFVFRASQYFPLSRCS